MLSTPRIFPILMKVLNSFNQFYDEKDEPLDLENLFHNFFYEKENPQGIFFLVTSKDAQGIKISLLRSRMHVSTYNLIFTPHLHHYCDFFTPRNFYYISHATLKSASFQVENSEDLVVLEISFTVKSQASGQIEVETELLQQIHKLRDQVSVSHPLEKLLFP